MKLPDLASCHASAEGVDQLQQLVDHYSDFLDPDLSARKQAEAHARLPQVLAKSVVWPMVADAIQNLGLIVRF